MDLAWPEFLDIGLENYSLFIAKREMVANGWIFRLD